MAANSSENKFSLSWHDSVWMSVLNADNVLDYFCQRSNTFYDKTCNNEHVKMQRLDPTQLQYMTGIEYQLIHAQEPILYIIRKQLRHSQSQVTPQAFYYILAGVVYQAPDIGSLINSRLLSSLHNLQSAFGEAQSYARYNPSKGYWWQFKDFSKKEKKLNQAAQPSSVFQRQRVDFLLAKLAEKFPPMTPVPHNKADEKESLKVSAEIKIELDSNATEPPLDNTASKQMSSSSMVTKSLSPPPSKRIRR